MRTVTVPAVLITLVLAGCSQTVPLPMGPDAPDPAFSHAARDHAARPRPFTGRCEAAIEPAQILAPGVIRQVDAGTCELSHLGRAQLHSDKVIHVAAGSQTTRITFTAANGDVLRAEGGGTSAPGGPGRVRFAANVTVTGGTGRFASATGRLHIEGEADLVNRTSALTLNGTIGYDAADRRQR